jgi:hypothetical protein
MIHTVKQTTSFLHQGIVPNPHNGLESLTIFVLITDNKFDFYNITEIADKKYRI